jgi:two-component system KDP operon response regulator KdpE
MYILIIDDDSVVRTMLVRMTRHLGYTALEASTLSDGMQIAREVAIGCVLLDVTLVGMRGGTGVQVLQKQLNIPIILMSGLDEESASRHLGAADRLAFSFLPKPFGLAEMQQTLAQAFMRAGALPAASA